MRISDWSSDVCSSDLIAARQRHGIDHRTVQDGEAEFIGIVLDIGGKPAADRRYVGADLILVVHATKLREDLRLLFRADRSEERRVGKGCVSPCRSRGSPYP